MFELLVLLPSIKPAINNDDMHALAVCLAYYIFTDNLNEDKREILVEWNHRLPSLYDTPHLTQVGGFIRQSLKPVSQKNRRYKKLFHYN